MYCNPIEFHASSNLTHLVRQRSSQWRVRWEDLSLPHLFLLLRIKGGRLLVLSLNSELMTDQVCVRGLARTETFLHVSNLQTIIWRHVSHLTPSLYRPLPPSLSCSHARTHARTHTHTHTHTHTQQTENLFPPSWENASPPASIAPSRSSSRRPSISYDRIQVFARESDSACVSLL